MATPRRREWENGDALPPPQPPSRKLHVKPDSSRNDGEPHLAYPAGAPVRRERLSVFVDPEQVYLTLFADERRAFWLDGGIHSAGGSSYLGTSSAARSGYLLERGRVVRLLDDDRVGLAGEPGEERGDDGSPGSTEQLHRSFADALRSWTPPKDGSAIGAPLGWVGWFGYEYGTALVGSTASPSPYPDAAMLAADRVVEVDHATGLPTLWFLDEPEGRAWADATRESLIELAASSAAAGGADLPRIPTPGASPSWRHGAADYLRMIAECQALIHAGDAYQLCLTNSVQVETAAEPLDVYRRLRRISRAAHGAFIRVDDVAVLSASPELFLSVGDGVAVTRPVKGTRRRGADPVEDLALRRELGGNEKERAENLMIVDLMRNDLGRVAKLGDVSVPELLAVETHEHVHQLVSTVRAELADGVDALDVVRVCFPAGSMTGTPKRAAMSILHELEGAPRGIYSGCLGRLGLDGSAELAMVIRTIVMSGGTASIGTGGGITALSVPADELAETRLKAAAPLAALGA